MWRVAINSITIIAIVIYTITVIITVFGIIITNSIIAILSSPTS